MRRTLRLFTEWIKSSRSDGEEGSALVEFALSACMLMTIQVVLIAVSMIVYSYTFVSDAAREATRYAMVRGLSLNNPCTAPGYATCIAQNDDIQSYVRGLHLPGIAPENLTVTTDWLTSVGAECGTQDSCKAPGNLVHVTVAYAYPVTLGFGTSKSFTMTSRSQSVIVQ
ncbi:MAG TPA: TadE family protein [Terracidiphilus sp.]|nr:TadE family protein [Terracidiphilus sp.]